MTTPGATTGGAGAPGVVSPGARGVMLEGRGVRHAGRPRVEARTLSALHLWVEAFECDSSILGEELPVDPLLGLVSPLFPLGCFLCERLSIWDASMQAVQG